MASQIKLSAVVIDCADASALAAFYAKLLDYNIAFDADGWAWIQSQDKLHAIGFQAVEGYEPPVWPWQEGKQAQMMHLDLSCPDVEAAAAFALECGAVFAEANFFDNGRVMLDPAGHPFCLCSALPENE